MSSFKDLVKQVNANKTKYTQYQPEEEEEEESRSSFKELVRNVNNGTIKVSSTLDNTQVDDWLTGVGSVYNDTYSYLTKEGYKSPNQDLTKRIDEYLSKSNEIGMYLRSNKDLLADYEGAYKSYVDSVSELNSLRNSLQSSNRRFSQWTEEEYNEALKNWQDYYAKWGHYTDREDYGKVSANRDYANPTGEDLGYYDAAVNSDYWYYDSNNVYRDAWGNELVTVPDEGGKFKGGNRWASPVELEDKYKVADPLGMYMSATEEERYMAQSKDDRERGAREKVLANGLLTHWELMTEDEVNLYYYLLGTEGLDTAMEYLAANGDKRNAKWGKMEAAKINNRDSWLGRTLGRGWLAIESGVDQWASGTAHAFGADVGAVSGTQYANSYMMESLSGLGKYLYQATNTVGNMLPTILMSKVTGVAGLGTAAMGVSSGGNAYAEAVRAGYDEDAAKNYGFLVGASEALLQKLIGGISAYGGVADDMLLAKASAIDSSFLRVSAKLGIKLGSEILEEEAQLFLEPLFKTILFDEDYDAPTIDAMVETAIVTALSTGALETTGTIGQDIAENEKMVEAGREIMDVDGGVNNLMLLADEMAGVSTGKTQKKLMRQTEKVSSKMDSGSKSDATARKVANLYQMLGTATNTQNQTDIARNLEIGGFSSKEANSIAEAIVAKSKGQQLTSKQEKVLKSVEGNAVVQSVLDTVVNNEKSSVGQRNQQMRNFSADIAINMLKKKFDAEQKKTVMEATEKEFAPEGVYDVSAKGKALRKDTNEAIEIKRISSIKKGEMLLELSDGSTINAKDVIYGNESDALIYEAVSKLGDKIDADTANKIMEQYKGGDAMVFARGMAQAYTYGFYGIDSSELMGEHSLATELDEAQRNVAYGLGKQYRPVKDAKDLDAAKKNKVPVEKGVYFRDKDGTVTDISTYLKESGTVVGRDVQKTAIEAMRKLSEVMGTRFVVFESFEENGKRYFINEKGEKEKAPNGYYSTDTGEIYIDLHAGNNGEGVMLFTIAHELTHFMRKWSPEHFRKISEIVFQSAGVKGDVTKLVALKQAQLKANKRKHDYDTALEEVVADSMETILRDGKVFEFMQEVKQQDYSSWQKLKNWFKNLAKFLRKMVWAYHDVSAQTDEGARVAAFSQDLLTQIERIFAEGAVASGENYQEAVDGYKAEQEQFSTANIRGNADGAVAQSEVAEALTTAPEGGILESPRTEYEALPKQMMNLSDGAGTILDFIEGLTATKVKGLGGKSINGYTGRDVRGYAMGISGFTKAQIQQVNKFMDTMADFMEDAGVTYKFIGLQDVENAKLHYTYNADGSIKSIVLSAMVKNGDYPVNFDLSSICKKRVAMSRLIDKLARRGTLDNGTVKLTPANIFKINTALKNAGYETACLGCFVESKRYNSLEWAKTFCNKWNAAVKKVNPNATYFGYGDASFTEDSFTLDQVIKIDDAATKYTKATKTERLQNALAKYRVKEQEGKPLVESFSKAALKRLASSDTISDELKAKYLNCDPTTLNISDVEFLLENGILPGAALSNKQAVTEMVKSGEAYQHLLRPSDLLTDRGISKLEALPNFHGVLYGHYGSGTPKLMQSYTPYNSEIALLPSKKGDLSLAEYLYSIAGVRMQSFSDFQIQNIYDYLQMVGDLAARKVPAHAYTKEISFAKLLGMTGIKVNLSVMFDIDPMVDKAHAGLTKLNKLVHRGEYAVVVLEDEQGKWVYNIGDYQTQKLFAEAFPDEAKRFLQSIGFADAVKLQSSPGYSANCGIIGVGYSDLGIFAMLNDKRIRYIIPYHASSLPAEIKVATNIALGTDYTPYQNNMKIKEIVDRNGNKVDWSIKEAYKRLRSGQDVINELNEKIRTEGWVVSTSKAQTGHGTYGLYEDLQQTNDPRQTASNFMDWCIGNGTLPLFYQFASHENYYKLIYDYNVYDCVTEEYAPQQAVTNTYPTMVDGQVQPGDVTDGGFDAEYLKGTIDKQMAFMDEYGRSLDEDLDALAENMEEDKYRFSPRDTSSVENDIADFVDEALNIKKSTKPISVGKMTDVDNRVINRLGRHWKGKYTGVDRYIEPRYVRHSINKHGNAFIEALRGQLHMDSDAIKIALSKLRAGKGQVVEGTYSVRGNPTIVTEIPINGYTLYAEEPINQLSGVDMEGRTIYIRPTSTMALKQNQSSVSIPQRRGGLNPSIEATSRIVNNFLTDSSGKATKFYGIDSESVSNPGRSTYGMTVLSTEEDALKTLGMPISKDSFNAKVSNPYIVTASNPLITDEDIKNSTVADRIAEVKRAGYDSIVMDYKPGDNYFVMVFEKESAVKMSDRDTDGNLLSKAQQEFFKDSKVRDANGNLLKVFHGTPKKFTTFRQGTAEGWGEGIYFTDNPEAAKEFGDNIVEAYLNITNPYNADTMSYYDLDFESTKAYQNFDKKHWQRWYDEYDTYEEYREDGMGVDIDMIYTEYVDVFNKILRELGYDGIIADSSNNIDGLEIVAFRENQPKLTSNTNPTESDDTRYSDRDFVAYDRTAILKEETVDRWLRAYATKSSPKYAQAYIAYMKPDQFLELTTSDYVARSHIESESSELDEEKFAKATSDQPLFLDIDHETGKVYGHEGRHRCVALQNAGIEDVPVLLFDTSNKYSKEDIPSILLNGQFNKYHREFVFDAIPLSYENRERVIQNFATQSSSQRFWEKTGTKDTLRFQDRTDDSISNRSLLANAFEGMAQNEIERNKIQEYRGKIDLIEAEEKKLRELNEQIKELSFAKGPRDTKAIRGLQFEARQTANRINTYDKQLLRLEASKPLQDVLAREKKKAYQAAEKRGKEALAAYKEKTAKTQRELLERWQESRKKGIESRSKTAMRHKIKDIVDELNKYLLKGTKERHVPIELQKAVAEALSVVNMDTVGAEERIAKLKDELLKAKTPEAIQEISRKIDHIQAMGDKINGRLQDLKNAYDNFLKSDDPLIANSHDEVISNKMDAVIDTVGNTPLRDMTLNQLEAVYDMYRMVLTSIRNANKAFKAKKSESISVLGNRVMEEVEQVGGKKKYTLKIAEGIKKFRWNNLKPVYAFERIGSDTFTEVFNNVRKGEDTWATDVSEARAYYLAQTKKHGYDSWDFNERFTFKSTSGLEFDLSLEQIMSLYAFSKRDQALEHLRKGGIVIDESTEVTMKTKLGIPMKFNPTEATAYNLSDEILADIVSKLSAEQKSFVDAMQDYLSTVMGAKGNEVSLEMYGIKLFKEKFYFPLKSATQYMAKAKEQQQGEAKIKNKGFSKETAPKASNPIVLTPFMDVWADHVNEMSMYHAFVLPMEDFYRVYNYKTPTSDTMATESVEMFIQNAYGKAATGYIDQLLKDLNGGAVADPRETFGKALTAKFKKAKVFSSLSVVIQQPSAIGRAFSEISPKYFHPTKDGKSHKELWEELKQYAPVAIIKEMGYFDTNMGRSTRDFIKAKEYSGFPEKAKAVFTDSGYRDEVLSKLPAWADEVTWCAIWNAVKRETVATHKDLRPGSEEFLKAAGERFTEIITKTQVYDSVLSRSANMRSKSGLMGMVTSFMAEPTTTINMIENALLQSKRGRKGYAGKVFAGVGISILLNNALVALVYGARDDDEDETFLEKYLSSFVGNTLDDLNPITYYPWLKDMWSLLQGYDVERADMSLADDFISAAESIVKAYNSDGDVVGAWHDLVGAFANLGGIPAQNIRREINGAINFGNTLGNGHDTTWGSLGNALLDTVKGSTPVWGWLPDDKKSDKLYDAIMDGDTAYVDRLKGGYKDETAYNTALRKALRDNDPRIKVAAKAMFSGDFEKYKEIFLKIKAEGNFDFDTIMGAVNAEVNELEKKAKVNTTDVTTETDEYDALFKVEHYYTAVANNDQASAEIIYKDLVDDKLAEGYLKHEAEDAIATGFATQVGDAYMAGEISRSKAVSLLKEHTDKDEGQVKKWDFELEHGFSWGERVRKYRLGVLSKSDLISAVMDIEGESRAGAEEYLKFLDLEMANADTDITANDAAGYFEYAQPAGIRVDVYLDYKARANKCESDKDENGNTISGSKKAKVMDVINSLPITKAQKDALYYANGWSENTINEAPWH